MVVPRTPDLPAWDFPLPIIHPARTLGLELGPTFLFWRIHALTFAVLLQEWLVPNLLIFFLQF